MMTGEPTSVLCAGLYSSGSTWVCNAVLDIWAERHGGDAACLVFADSTAQFEDEALRVNKPLLAIKTHAPTTGLRLMAQLADLPVILSVREPRDAVASLISRFGLTFDAALELVRQSAEMLSDLADLDGASNAAFFRYEDGFTADPASVQAIATRLKVPIPAAKARRIAAELGPAAVKAKIARLAEEGVFEDRPPAETFDPKTHWHPSHVGDGKVGKWQAILTAAQAAQVAYATRRFSAAFGYAGAPQPWSPDDVLDFSLAGTGAYYLEGGFSYPETWGVWSEGPIARIRIPLARPLSTSITLQVEVLLGPSLSLTPDALVQVQVNQWHSLTLQADPALSGRSVLSVRVDAAALDGAREIVIDVLSDHVLSGVELGDTDTRRLGLGLCSLRVVPTNHTIAALAYQRDARARAPDLQDDAVGADGEPIRADADTPASALALMTAAFEEATGNLEKRSAERDALARQCAAIAADRDALRSERDALSADCDVVLAEREALRSECATVRSNHDRILAERDDLRSQGDLARAERDRALAEREALQSEREALRAERDALMAGGAEADRRLQVLTQVLEDLSQTIEGLTRERDRVQDHAKALGIAVEEETAKVLDLAKERERLAQHLAQMTADHEALVVDRAQLRTAKDAVEAELGEFRTSTRRLGEERDLAVQDADRLKTELQALQGDRDGLQDRIETLKAALGEAEQRASRLERERDDFAARSATIAAEHDALQAALDGLRADHGAQAEQLGNVSKRLHHLQEEASAAGAQRDATAAALGRCEASVAAYGADLAELSSILAELAAFDALDRTTMSAQHWEERIAAFEAVTVRAGEVARTPEMATSEAALASLCSNRVLEAKRRSRTNPFGLLRGRLG